MEIFEPEATGRNSLARERKELPEIGWCQNDRNFDGFAAVHSDFSVKGPKRAFLAFFGPQGYTLHCWLRRAGCVSQDAYILHIFLYIYCLSQAGKISCSSHRDCPSTFTVNHTHVGPPANFTKNEYVFLCESSECQEYDAECHINEKSGPQCPINHHVNTNPLVSSTAVGGQTLRLENSF